jgi:hypothetical protein
MRRQVRHQRPMPFFPRQPNTPPNHLLERRLVWGILIEGSLFQLRKPTVWKLAEVFRLRSTGMLVLDAVA